MHETHNDIRQETDPSASAGSPPIRLWEAEETTWRLVLHALRACDCVTFAQVRDEKWIAVEAHVRPFLAEDGSIDLSLHRLTPSEAEELATLACEMAGREHMGVGSDRLTVRLHHCRCMDGFLQVSGRWIDEPFSEHDRITLDLLGRHVLSVLRDALTGGENEYSLANVDYLTGLFNYRYLQQRLMREVLQADLTGRPLSLLMVDLVHYKDVNDTYGHEVGNIVLAQLASLLRGAVRETDIVCRYGGDEFVVMLPHTNSEQALAAAHRLEASMRASRVEVAEVGAISTPQLTIGVSTFPAPASSAAELVQQADAAQYRAKGSLPPAICLFEAASGSWPSTS